MSTHESDLVTITARRSDLEWLCDFALPRAEGTAKRIRALVRATIPCDFADAEVVGAEATADYCYSHQDFCQ